MDATCKYDTYTRNLSRAYNYWAVHVPCAVPGLLEEALSHEIAWSVQKLDTVGVMRLCDDVNVVGDCMRRVSSVSIGWMEREK